MSNTKQLTKLEISQEIRRAFERNNKDLCVVKYQSKVGYFATVKAINIAVGQVNEELETMNLEISTLRFDKDTETYTILIEEIL